MTQTTPPNKAVFYRDEPTTEIVYSEQLHNKVKDLQQFTRACLVVIQGPDVGKVFELVSDQLTIGRTDESAIKLNDSGISRRHAALARDNYVIHIEDLDSANGTFVNGEPVKGQQRLIDGDKVSLGKNTLLKFTYCDDLDSDYQQRLVQAALKDFLTGVYNRRYFDHQLAIELAHAQRHQHRLSVILFDVDHFKLINDTHGHPVGDGVLAKLCALVHHTVRTDDLLARLGGEEFALLVRDHNSSASRQLAERLLKLIAETEFTVGKAVVRITVSMGIAVYPEITATTPNELVAAADGALYRAKNRGRNCCVLAGGDGSDETYTMTAISLDE